MLANARCERLCRQPGFRLRHAPTPTVAGRSKGPWGSHDDGSRRSSGKGAYLEGHGTLMRIRYACQQWDWVWWHKGLGRRIVARLGLGRQEAGPYNACAIGNE